MSSSSRLGLPYLAAGQAQKHVTVNESLLRLDALTQLTAVSATTSTQPASPTDGDIYLLPDGKSGAAWDAMANGALAYYRDGYWEEITPKQGWRCLAIDTEALYVRGGGSWWRAAASSERRLLFTPGGDGVTSIYRISTTRIQNPRTAAIASISGDLLTLTTSTAILFFDNAFMAGVSYVRIWNTTKTPAESAWVKAQPAAGQLQVTDAANVTGWSPGDTIQVGDPTDQTPNRCVALDISPMMQAVLGRVFPQLGVLAKLQSHGISASAQLDLTENGVAGSFQIVKSFTDGSMNHGQVTVPCSVPSPISDSNLIFLRETISGTAFGTAAAFILGIWV
jgi:hypothetical protein